MTSARSRWSPGPSRVERLAQLFSAAVLRILHVSWASPSTAPARRATCRRDSPAGSTLQRVFEFEGQEVCGPTKLADDPRCERRRSEEAERTTPGTLGVVPFLADHNLYEEKRTCRDHWRPEMAFGRPSGLPGYRASRAGPPEADASSLFPKRGGLLLIRTVRRTSGCQIVDPGEESVLAQRGTGKGRGAQSGK